jgi:hypothetical protein
MKDTNQGEQPPGRIKININFPCQPLDEHFRSLIMDAAPGHIDGLNVLGGSGPDRLKIAVADRPIFADRALEAGEAEDDGFEWTLILAENVEYQPPLLNAKGEAIGADIAVGVAALWLEMIAFEQIENGNAPFLALRQMMDFWSSSIWMIRGSDIASHRLAGMGGFAKIVGLISWDNRENGKRCSPAKAGVQSLA